MWTLFAIGFLLLMSGCAAEPDTPAPQSSGKAVVSAAAETDKWLINPPHPPSEGETLDETDLRAALVGKLVVRDQERLPGKSTEGGEKFLPNGRYVLLGDRADTPGVYEFKEHQVCITTVGSSLEECRVIVKDAAGLLLFVRITPGNDFRPWPIEIYDVRK